MTKFLAVKISVVGAIGLVVLTAAAGAAAATEPAPDRCFDASAGKHKTSLGAHQWTLRVTAEWCVADAGGRPHIVSTRRSTRVRTGTNWKLISRASSTEREGSRRATVESRAHFRLRYPYFEQNCYPRVAIEVQANGAFTRTVRTGC
jgi:opacity protein-like surface antigen